jgi:ubiquinone/menaquinone biosynthesis C-methylase UbiE
MPEAGNPLDTSAAEAYEKLLVPALYAPFSAEVVALAGPRPGEHVLDVACGTGIAIRLAAPRVAPGGRVAGLDLDPAMIAVARNVVKCPDDVTLDWHCASALEMPFEAGTFDLVLCVQGLQFLPDCAAGLAEIRRVMKPGGRLVAVVWRSLEHCKGQHAIVQALERRKIDATPMLKAYSMGDPDRVRKLAGEAGFRNVVTRSEARTARFASTHHFVEALAAGGPASRLALSKVPENQRSEFREEVNRSLRQYEDKEGVVLPLGYLVLLARS